MNLRALWALALLSLGLTTALAQEATPPWRITWRLGPDYPMGIQDSAMGAMGGVIVSAGGFTRHPLDVVKKYPDAFGSDPRGSGFTKLSFVFDPAHPQAGWRRITDLPGPARQGEAVAVVNDALWITGGISYDAPYTYRETYRLCHAGDAWVWTAFPSCRLPWPIYGGSGSTAVIGSKIYLIGAADFFTAPGASGHEFHTESGRGGSPVGRALLVLDTRHPEAGWKRLADCPGVPQFDAAVAAAGGKVYRMGGVYAPLDVGKDVPYYNAVDSWAYDPATDRWSQLADMPPGSNRHALTYRDRYIVFLAGYRYARTRRLDGGVTDENTAARRAAEFKHESFMGLGQYFEKTVLIYDTVTGRLSRGDPLIEQTSDPSATVLGDTLYSLGGEGGPRTWHPATFQIGQIVPRHAN